MCGCVCVCECVSVGSNVCVHVYVCICTSIVGACGMYYCINVLLSYMLHHVHAVPSCILCAGVMVRGLWLCGCAAARCYRITVYSCTLRRCQLRVTRFLRCLPRLPRLLRRVRRARRVRERPSQAHQVCPRRVLSHPSPAYALVPQLQLPALPVPQHHRSLILLVFRLACLALSPLRPPPLPFPRVCQMRQMRLVLPSLR